MTVIKVDRATQILNNDNDHQTYRQVREKLIPPGVAFRIGKALRFNEEALKEWIARGGTPLGDQQPTAAQSVAA